MFTNTLRNTHATLLSLMHTYSLFLSDTLILSSSAFFSHMHLFSLPLSDTLSLTYRHTQTFSSFLTPWFPDFLSPCSLKAEPNQLVCRNYRAINNQSQSAAAETGGGETRVMGPLLSACAAQDAGASDL